jgi:phosphoserine phosphatase RsbU/P
MHTTPRILLADDQPDVLMALRLLLKGDGCETESAANPEAAFQAAAVRPPSLVLMDLNYTRDTTSGQEGLGLLDRLQRLPDPPPVVVMTAWGSIELAVEAMRRGARDFVPKPWDNARLLETVRKHIAAAPRTDAIARDLEIARRVQRQLLPRTAPALASLDLDAHCLPAGRVGGDFFDYLHLGPGRTGIVLADISGKGVAAALLMANLQAAIRSLAPQIAEGLPCLLRALNAHFLASTAPEHFASLIFAVYNESSRQLAYVNCGHPPALVLRQPEGSIEFLAPTAPVLGVVEDYQPDPQTITLRPGDRFVLYSDGASEPFVDEEGLKGEHRLLELMQTPHALQASAIAAVLAAEQEVQADDITIVIGRAR